jgi:hypothetical protein
VLEGCFRKSKIACLTQITDPHSLRDGAFDASTDGIAIFEGFCALPRARESRSERLESLGPEGQGAGLCLGTLRTTWAKQTSSWSKFHVDHRRAPERSLA